MPDYDVLVRGGRLLDAAAGRDGAFDVAIRAGLVAAVEPHGVIPPSAAAEVINYDIMRNSQPSKVPMPWGSGGSLV